MDFFKEQALKRPLPDEISSDSTLKKILSIIKKDLSPTHVFFYGSRANLTHHENSDYDFVVVVPNSEDASYKRSIPVKKKLSDIGISTDIFIYTEDKFNDWKDEFSSTPETAINTGYEVTHL